MLISFDLNSNSNIFSAHFLSHTVIILFGVRESITFLNNCLIFAKIERAAKNEVLNFVSSQPHFLNKEN